MEEPEVDIKPENMKKQDDLEDEDVEMTATEDNRESIIISCTHCKVEVTSKSELIEHLLENNDCMKGFGSKNFEKMQKEGTKLITAQYQPDENLACCPIVEDSYSKLDHSMPEKIRTLPSNTFLCAGMYIPNYSDIVEAFVGMTLSNDGESVEVKTLVNKDNITDLGNFMDLFHAIMAIMDADVCSLTLFKHSPFILNSTGMNLACLRNKFSTELIDSDGRMPDPPETTCIPDKTRERMFLSETMANSVPNQQLLINANLDFRDMAAVGVKLKRNKHFEIRPLFSVNMLDDWIAGMKTLGSILTTWFGNKDVLNDYFSKLPCFVSAANRFVHETYLDCLDTLKKPLVRAACKHCGLEFKYNPYLFKEKGKYKHHESTHDLICKHCGLECESHAQKIYHMRTHKSVNFPCEQCKFVGSSQKSLDSHIKYKHTEAVCHLCGKTTSCAATLDIHLSYVHKLKVIREEDKKKYFCHICGKPYCNKQVLKKHVQKHAKEDSKVNKYMLEDPKEYKYMCTRHDNCKKYFKKARYLKKHLQQYGDKAYPHQVQEQCMPFIPADQTFITDQDKEFWEIADRADDAEDRQEKLKKLIESGTPVSVDVTLPKSQMGIGNYPCHLCNKTYDRKNTLEKHLQSHAKTDSTVNKVMNEDPSEYKYMCTRHVNCKKYFKKARYLKNHLQKFAHIPYPDNAGSHYMPDIRPDQKFITDKDPELLHMLGLEEKERREEDKERRINKMYSQLKKDPPNMHDTDMDY